MFMKPLDLGHLPRPASMDQDGVLQCGHKDNEIGRLQKLLDDLISHDMAMIAGGIASPCAELQRAIAYRQLELKTTRQNH